jgi:asparagine synthase (glutamine-hydrolysing)
MVPADASVDSMRFALEAMRNAQQHRGPDDPGAYWNESTRTGLAACRLAIRDLSAAGHMPMCDAEVCITYNGEIYNAAELRGELQQRGQRFTSHSDTEVILRGYLEWGDDVVTRLRGMFAFAILDAPRRRLLLARDPLGIKPLYYKKRTPFAFASELRAFSAARLIDQRIDPQALSAFLQLGSVPAPLTIFEEVNALPPGHVAIVRTDAPFTITTRRYWDWPSTTGTATVADVEAALIDAMAAHLVSDVPVGAFLSGGLDSATVVTLTASMTREPLQTCSIAFESAEHDESEYARAVATALGTQHHERVVTRADFFDSMGAFIAAMDQPSIDGFNAYFVAETAHNIGLKVALSGLGGDELFGGYPSFRGVPRVMRTLKSTRALAGGGALRVLASVVGSDRWRKVASATRSPPTPASALLVYRGLFTREEVEGLLPEGTHFDAADYIEQRAGPTGAASPDWIARAELGTYTAAQLLRDSDVMSMAHSLELRVPLLDTRLLETISALPNDVRFHGRGNKPLLRRLMATRLPPVVTNRRRRQGFTFPLQQWLMDHAGPELWQWDAPIFQQFERPRLAEVQKRFLTGHGHWSRVWSLIALNEWSRRVAHA